MSTDVVIRGLGGDGDDDADAPDYPETTTDIVIKESPQPPRNG